MNNIIIDTQKYNHRYGYFQYVIKQIQDLFLKTNDYSKFKPIYVIQKNDVIYLIDGFYRYNALKDLLKDEIRNLFIFLNFPNPIEIYFFILNLKHKNRLKIHDIGLTIDKCFKDFILIYSNQYPNIYETFKNFCLKVYKDYALKNRKEKYILSILGNTVRILEPKKYNELIDYIRENKRKDIITGISYSIENDLFSQKDLLFNFGIFFNRVLSYIEKTLLKEQSGF